MNIYSKIEPDKLLHIINRKNDIAPGRVDLVPENQFIQCAAMKMQKETTFKPHKHIWKESSFMVTTDKAGDPYIEIIAQESWVVISGVVKVILYDIDDTVLHDDILEAGDCSITLEGAHNYLIIQDAVVYEFKTGPYLGQEHDKIFI